MSLARGHCDDTEAARRTLSLQPMPLEHFASNSSTARDSVLGAPLAIQDRDRQSILFQVPNLETNKHSWMQWKWQARQMAIHHRLKGRISLHFSRDILGTAIVLHVKTPKYRRLPLA